MMQFIFSIPDLINALFITGGIGICLLCFLQITASVHLRKEVRGYFQAFFLLIIFYILHTWQGRLWMGCRGDRVRIALYVITFAEMLDVKGFDADEIVEETICGLSEILKKD